MIFYWFFLKRKGIPTVCGSKSPMAIRWQKVITLFLLILFRSSERQNFPQNLLFAAFTLASHLKWIPRKLLFSEEIVHVSCFPRFPELPQNSPGLKTTEFSLFNHGLIWNKILSRFLSDKALIWPSIQKVSPWKYILFPDISTKTGGDTYVCPDNGAALNSPPLTDYSMDHGSKMVPAHED